ncbi:acetyltransferase (GNAT) family protein [Desulfobotulus alkaliphilus]|uniref:Acetyltransferase (GNAT) family protein n=1 Tax=Desulfobotulus alkaliphilus TaxID=622671 RepID=A0A562RTT0_9BACT|nr:GNAT family N-acetyltransferase [Desulfobotulus alkaliphilus]TWI72273.1 acetyltransferase (GNAT) family protein [Desulfobotulus alkaliphilus]
MEFFQMDFGSDAYAIACDLRHEILRKPIGLSLYEEDLGQEKNHLHFGLRDARQKLLACVIAVPLSKSEARIRQMAVAPRQQGQGCGRYLLLEMENLLAEKGFTRLSMHARSSAEGFYAKLGYLPVGRVFMEVGLPHLPMVKNIENKSGGTFIG